jgi:hypothetical protein
MHSSKASRNHPQHLQRRGPDRTSFACTRQCHLGSWSRCHTCISLLELLMKDRVGRRASVYSAQYFPDLAILLYISHPSRVEVDLPRVLPSTSSCNPLPPSTSHPQRLLFTSWCILLKRPRVKMLCACSKDVRTSSRIETQTSPSERSSEPIGRGIASYLPPESLD